MATFLEGRITGCSGRGACVGARDDVAAVLDILSSFVRIVTPPLRPVNFDLLSGREKEDVDELVGILLSCSATFRAVHDDFGRDVPGRNSGTYRLDPYVWHFRVHPAGCAFTATGNVCGCGLCREVDVLIDFPGQPFLDNAPQMSDVVKKIVAHEVLPHPVLTAWDLFFAPRVCVANRGCLCWCRCGRLDFSAWP